MRLYGAIGPRVDGDYFAQELASLDRGDFDMIHIRMNSPGGNVFQGMSIVSAILSMNTPVCVHIDGIAASMAAVVAVAADRVCMMDFAKMMIHDPYFTGESGKATSPKQKKALARLTDMLRQVLVRRGKDEATMAKLMREETWFSAAEALDAGLCDEITSSARNEFMNLDPMQLVAAVDAEYQTNNQEQMEKINLSAEAIVALGSKSGQMDEAAVSAAIVAAVAAKDEEIANLKAAKETAEAEIARLRKEKEDAVAGQVCREVVGRAGPCRTARRAQSQPPRPLREEVQGDGRLAAHLPGIAENASSTNQNRMALQVEIWVKSIIEGLFANNTFAARSVDHSEFVNEKTVHVPNAGAAPNVEKNRTVFPANVTERKDVDLIYQMDEFTVDPVRIPHAEQVELSYNKRESVTRQSRRKLAQDIYESIIYNWIPEGVKVVETLGEAVAAHIKEATGNRKRMTKQTVEELQTLFDEQDIPEEGRCILLDARMYNQLLNSLTDAERNGFLVCADPARGVIGKYLGFDFYKRSKVAKVATDGTLKPWSAANAATDCAAGLAWHEDCVSRALGDSLLFDDQGNPLYYGDIISFLQRAGGKSIRADKAGVVLIRQAAAE